LRIGDSGICCPRVEIFGIMAAKVNKKPAARAAGS
jgi:hypothetical protein